MDFEQIKTSCNQNIANTYGRFDVAIKQGENACCEDYNGKKYIDFTSGIGVNSLGFCNQDWAAAICKQATTLNHTSNLYYTSPMVELAQTLCQKTGFTNMFFANSGAEANEGAIKTARKYSQDKYSKDRYEIITLVNSFHGRTVTTLSATGQDAFHNNFTPLTEGFVYATANDINDVKDKISSKTCAIMIEIVQGEGGVIALDKDFVHQLNTLCAEQDILLIVDEVQTGIGRTGTILASMQYDITPDITTLAKGLGGGLPIGAVLFGEKCSDVLKAGDHGSTFGGNPIVCAGAKVILDKLTDDFLAEVNQKASLIKSCLNEIEGIKSIDGLGLMIGIEFENPNINVKQVIEKCIENGVLFLSAKHKLRMLPPLTITNQNIKDGLSVLKDVLKQLN